MRGLERMDVIALSTNAIADIAQTAGRIDEPVQFLKLLTDVEDAACLTSLVNSVTVAVNELKKFNAASFPNIFSKDDVATYSASRTALKLETSQQQWCCSSTVAAVSQQWQQSCGSSCVAAAVEQGKRRCVRLAFVLWRRCLATTAHAPRRRLRSVQLRRARFPCIE